MSSLATIIKDEPLASTLRFGFFGLAACSIVGVAAYIGYKAAGPNKTLALYSRHPESNDQVRILKNLNTYHCDRMKYSGFFTMTS